jgi:predicted DNA-binding transcriptional regulator YafY
MDILRQGAEVEVLAPASLRDEVKRTAARIVSRYELR